VDITVLPADIKPEQVTVPPDEPPAEPEAAEAE
jgi:hypothetical protein